MNRIEFGDCRETMRRWAADGVKAHMCVTSPPYFGLRDYGHDGQIGLEQTPEEYITAMVEVFRCVRDVLADDGTLWLNIGDSYSTHPPTNNNKGNENKIGTTGDVARAAAMSRSHKQKRGGLPEKNLMGIPWRVALALQADGWILRQDIIWNKPNPAPEGNGAKDRCTKAHEYIFLLSKGPRYFFDSDGIAEPSQMKGVNRNRRSVWTVPTKRYGKAHFATFPPALIEPCILAGSRPGDIVLDPFMGSGTTAQVALQHGRQYLGCELNLEYNALQQERIARAVA